MNNIIVIDTYFNLKNKFNHIHRLYYNLIPFFDHLVVAYFKGTLYNISQTWRG